MPKKMRHNFTDPSDDSWMKDDDGRRKGKFESDTLGPYRNGHWFRFD